jgi:hypothetical protein
MAYEIRLAFDAGSGTCLWAKNEAAREKYGYPINHWELPLSENTKRYLQHLVAWFDTSLNWEAPSDSDNYWTDEELNRFKQAVHEGHQLLCQELPPPQFVFVNEAAA